ncbi:hypothetical protein [Ensifer sp. Root31]|uniref:hypothetical protein n=1 Tax=Ensifer sp. Root31 TaxID=1736512 RepID=UPI0012E78FC9|nr:hypothetical protein [Ensifer sp. Root31]
MPDKDSEFSEHQKQLANAVALTIYGAAAPIDRTAANLRIILQSITGPTGPVVVSPQNRTMSYTSIKPVSPQSVKDLSICFEKATSEAAGDRCVSHAIALGLVSGFSEYRKSVDESLASNRSKSCFRNYL